MHPLLERVRFLAIASNNLDEFHMGQVAALRRRSPSGTLAGYGEGPAGEIVTQIKADIDRMAAELNTTWRKLREELAEAGIVVLRCAELQPEDAAWVTENFQQEIFPILTPLAVSPTHPFPFIPNRGLAIAASLETSHSPQRLNGIVRVPVQLSRFVRLPGAGDRFVAVEDVIEHHLATLFPSFAITGSGVFRIIRDGDLDVEEMEDEDDAEHLLLSFETALQRRRHGDVVSLSISPGMPDDLSAFLIEQLDIDADAVDRAEEIVGLAGLTNLIGENRQDLLFRPFSPRVPERLRDFAGDCFSAIRAKDLLVHHPYESFDVVVQFIRQATADPAVVAIKQTLYRTSANSPIVQALVEAAQAGKSVTAVVELKARYDEEANLKWARDLERAGAQVTYGFLELKIHAKLSLVVRREAAGLASYIHYGTGNYHPVTARIYTDLSLFTCDPDLCADAARLFNFMTGYAPPHSLSKIAAAPISLRRTLIELIEAEAEHARRGEPAAIWFKLNGLLDGEIIEALYKASAAGVAIDGIVRGMCALRARVPGLSDNIRIRSIVGRYLEHARIVCFGAGAGLPSPAAKVFISSADWMPRNFDHRIETLVPIENETVHRQIIEQIMIANLKDDTAAWTLGADDSWRRVPPGRNPFSSQTYFMSNGSLSGRGTALDEGRAPPSLKLPSQKVPGQKMHRR